MDYLVMREALSARPRGVGRRLGSSAEHGSARRWSGRASPFCGMQRLQKERPLPAIQGSRDATALVGMPGFVVGAQVDGEPWLYVETGAIWQAVDRRGTPPEGLRRPQPRRPPTEIAFYLWCADADVPELARLARTISRRAEPIFAYHTTGRASNGRVENPEMLAEKVRPISHGSANGDNYRRRLPGRPGITPHRWPGCGRGPVHT